MFFDQMFAEMTHHWGSLVTDNTRPWLEASGVHDAGGGNVDGHHIEPQ